MYSKKEGLCGGVGDDDLPLVAAGPERPDGLARAVIAGSLGRLRRLDDDPNVEGVGLDELESVIVGDVAGVDDILDVGPGVWSQTARRR